MAINVLGHSKHRQDFFLPAFGCNCAPLILTWPPDSQSTKSRKCYLHSSLLEESFLSLLAAQSSFNYVQPQKCHFIYQKATLPFLNGFGPATLSNSDYKNIFHSRWAKPVAILHDEHAFYRTTVWIQDGVCAMTY